jgi:hypothetical protein
MGRKTDGVEEEHRGCQAGRSPVEGAVLEQQRADIAVTLEELEAVEARCRERLAELDRKR